MAKIRRIRGELLTPATARAFATVRGIPPGFNVLEVDVPSATLERFTVAFGPRIKKVYFYDASVPAWREYTTEATDRNTASVFPLSEMQTADRLYVGCTRRYAGLSADVVGTNGAGTAAMVGEYPRVQTWTDLTITDGTFSTRTLAQDGLVTWTVPAVDEWQAETLRVVAGEPLMAPETEQLFWTRLRVDATLTDTSVTVAEITALFNATLNALTGNNEGQDVLNITSNNFTKAPYRFELDTDRYGSVEVVSATLTTADLVRLNWLEER